jgi:hypothetical protein
MKQSDKHTWVKDKNIEKHCCKTCGCIRTKEFTGRHSEFFYERSGIGFGTQRPDCLDWNDNTLD